MKQVSNISESGEYEEGQGKKKNVRQESVKEVKPEIEKQKEEEKKPEKKIFILHRKKAEYRRSRTEEIEEDFKNMQLENEEYRNGGISPVDSIV